MPEHVHGESEAEPRLIRGLRLAMILTAVILVIEAAGAFASRSLSLTVDAAHSVPDIIAFAVSWLAIRSVERGPSDRDTFGAHRFEVFAGILNAALVLAVGVGFAGEAILSLKSGTPFDGPVDPAWILVAAIPTLALRGVNLLVLYRIPGRVRDLNLRSVLVHLGSDVVITVALIGAGLTLLFQPTVWWADPAAAAFIGVVLCWESIPLFGSAWEVLTERTPSYLSIEAIQRAVLRVSAVTQVHDLHVWAVCPTLVCMSAHIRVREMSVRDSMVVVTELRSRMEKEFGIAHAVFQVEASSAP